MIRSRSRLGGTGRVRRRWAARSVFVAILVLAGSVGATGGERVGSSGPEPVVGPLAEPLAPDYSDAELLLRMQQAYVDDLQRISLLQARQRELDRQFERLSTRFKHADALLQSLGASPGEERPPEPEPETETEPALPAADIAQLEEQWRALRDQLDLLLQRRQLLTQQLELLERKRIEQQAAAALISSGRQVPGPSPDPAMSAATDPSHREVTVPAATPADDADAAAPPRPGMLALAPAATDPDASTAAEPPPTVYDARVARALRERARQDALLASTEQAARMAEALTSLNEDEHGLIRASIALAERHAGLLQQQADTLEARAAEATPAAAASGLLTASPEMLRRDATAALHAASIDGERLEVVRARLDALARINAHLEAALDAAGEAAAQARRRVEFLSSPFAPHRIADWMVSALPRVVAALAVLALLWFGARWLARHVVGSLVSRIRPAPDEQRLQRVETLRRALRSALTVVVVAIAALWIMPEFGLDPRVLLGGAAVLSLAVAFGAQSLVKDYFSGFMILSENQYRIGNVVRINDLAGVVEDITLRMTMLRDAEGTAHFIPHGEITTVSNLTHGWAQVVLDVRVGFGENVDRVMEELLAVAHALRQDPAFAALIVSEPELWGVDALTDSAVIIKLALRTRPLKQWEVKRQLLRRVKNRFDELGIELPTAQLTVRVDSASRGDRLDPRLGG